MYSTPIAWTAQEIAYEQFTVGNTSKKDTFIEQVEANDTTFSLKKNNIVASYCSRGRRRPYSRAENA